MNTTRRGRAVEHNIFLTDGWGSVRVPIQRKWQSCEVSCCDVRRSINTLVGFHSSNNDKAFVHLVGWGASLLIGKSVWVDGEAEAWSLDTVLRLGLVELILGSSLLLLLPLLPLLPPVTSLLGTFGAELRRPWGRLGGGAPSPTVLATLCGCCRSNLPTNRSTNTVVIATSCLSQRLSPTGVE